MSRLSLNVGELSVVSASVMNVRRRSCGRKDAPDFASVAFTTR